MKLSLLQMKTMATPEENIVKIKAMLKKAKAEGADMAVLPEMCCCPYENSAFVRYAMAEKSPFLTELAETAKELGIYLVAGSVPEQEDKKIYNTSFVYNPKGECIARHRKVHLFDINVEGGQYFMESDTFTAGEDVTTFDTPWGKFGLMICYDIRFPELSRLLALKGVQAILVPAAFNMTTGPAHWELSFRMRALDNQVFMAGCAPARDINSSYHAWGHSIVTDPWGSVVEQLDEKEGILTVELDFEKVEKLREQLPLLKHRRTDLYLLESKMVPASRLYTKSPYEKTMIDKIKGRFE
ncbi:nitrilase-related carbon-nitrogen hydrolase [Anaerotignum sp.]